ncbi:MAG: hypothetical protein O2843_03100 [Chloroflexi bacterium]|nr:hypothetical protein [Chloroflexota bacterium]
MQTREQVTEIVTLTTEEYVVETETIVNESYVIPVEHEVTVRDYDSIATAQSAPAVSAGASPDRALSTLDARLEGVVTELSARQAALEEQMMALARGDGLDAASAREAVRALAADVFGLADAHASLTGSMVAVLFAETPGAPTTTPSKAAPSKPAASEPTPAKSP